MVISGIYSEALSISQYGRRNQHCPPREVREKSIASIATNTPNCHDSPLQLGLITTISHSLQVSGLENARTTTRFNSKTACQAMDGLIIPLPSSQFITVQYDRGGTRILAG